ncbi:divergent polysaccharide deacetylase family protein [Limobrevibacterium gyesilva]|uniref:Divergent polysaccharide deacetylase family protein n=1 Tax=Limobrevibacterium gyesilva TaxID=2991712 RepID=A0AA42CHS7_9PROT|nr:divergent polysaccharide deacetylase family protein [Limobrevibacterium gyesilva]MCW3477571.1 divergent polysaccharide deacetylase family protein [Limobrevibacterium gyesilva]
MEQQGRWRSVLGVLALFWGSVALLAGGGAAVLQVLGPPPEAVPAAAPKAARTTARAAPAPTTPAPATPAPDAAAPPAPGPAKPPPARAAIVVVPHPGAPVPPPDPALLEPSPAYRGASLPRIGPGRRLPLQTYAAGYDPADPRPRIAVLLSGLGMSEQDSEEAIRTLPPAVSFAFSPYALRPDRLLEAARARGHEALLSIPMEPQNYPLNDAGSYALLTSLSQGNNALRLEWALSRIAGYVGATGGLGRLHGERFADAREQMGAVLEELASRGLLYVDPRPGARPFAGDGLPPQRSVDLMIDAPPVRTEIEAKLAQLEQLARDRGNALGLADTPLPVTTERIAAWAATLSQRGFVLTPVSALIAAPPHADPQSGETSTPR